MSVLYPVNLVLDGRPVLLVGGGVIATQKGKALAAAGARIHVVAPQISVELAQVAAQISARAFDVTRDLDGAHFVVAAAPLLVNEEVTKAAHQRGLFVLAVDQPAIASAQSPAVLRRGAITVAISTQGAAPALAGLLREALEALLPDDDEAERWLALANRAREAWRQTTLPHHRKRSLLLDTLVSLYMQEHT